MEVQTQPTWTQIASRVRRFVRADSSEIDDITGDIILEALQSNCPITIRMIRFRSIDWLRHQAVVRHSFEKMPRFIPAKPTVSHLDIDTLIGEAGLDAREKLVIFDKFYLDELPSETCRTLYITRQLYNQLLNSALTKLRQTAIRQEIEL